MQITSTPQSLEKIFQGVNTRYVVPHYQRDYTWTQDQWAELWNDITTAFDSSQEYFLGSFVLNTEMLAAGGAYEIVDGQQRLTTFTILFTVVRDLARHFVENPHDEAYVAMALNGPLNKEKAARAEKIAGNLVVHLGEPDYYFLKLNDKDHPIFHEYIQKENDPLITKEQRKTSRGEPRLKKGKKFFTRKFIERFLKEPDGFLRVERFLLFCVTKLVFLRIEVSNDNDAYLLFETLNDRGLDLSISDLVKNRLLLGCNSNQEKKARVLSKWNDLMDKLSRSRFQPHDYLWFYWIAFEQKCTKKELYRLIRDALMQADGELILDRWLSCADFFCEITNRDLKFPHSELTHGSAECYFAELKSLGYSVYIPLFLFLKREKPALVDRLVGPAASYLFRVITVGGFSAGRAESRFEKIQEAVKAGKAEELVLGIFAGDPEADDEKFAERIRTQRFDKSGAARHLLAKIHLSDHGEGHPLNQDVHLEHVLPQKTDAWPDFDLDNRAREDWVYNIGNMTLLERKLNSSVQAAEFEGKIPSYRKKESAAEKGSAIPMTYKIAGEHNGSGREWDHGWITERAAQFADKAPGIWPLPPFVVEASHGNETNEDVSATESEDGLL